MVCRVGRLRLLAIQADVGGGILVGLFLDVRLKVLPVVAVVAHFFAIHAGGQEGFDLPQVTGEIEDAPGDKEPPPNFVGVDRFDQEVVHSGPNGGVVVAVAGAAA